MAMWFGRAGGEKASLLDFIGTFSPHFIYSFVFCGPSNKLQQQQQKKKKILLSIPSPFLSTSSPTTPPQRRTKPKRHHHRRRLRRRHRRRLPPLRILAQRRPHLSRASRDLPDPVSGAVTGLRYEIPGPISCCVHEGQVGETAAAGRSGAVAERCEAIDVCAFEDDG